MSSWLGKVWASRILREEIAKHTKEIEGFKNDLLQEAEKHRVKLKKSEFIFQKEYEAASALVSMIRDIDPKNTIPDMDWDVACDHAAMNFGDIENTILSYLKVHGAGLPQGVKDNLTFCYGAASTNKFEASPEVSDNANKAANDLLKTLVVAENEMIQHIREQITT